MSDLKKVYSVSVKAARAEANKKVRAAEKGYHLLKDKNSDYAIIVKAVLDLYIQSAEVYNNAPSEITLN